MATIDEALFTKISPRGKARRGSPGERLWRALVWLVLVAGACVMILPFLWLVSSSLKTELAVFRFPPQWIPNPPQFQNYVEAWTRRPFGLYIRNTFVIMALCQIGVLVSATLCGYGFARIDFPGRDFWFKVLLSTMMLPGIVTMIPQFVIFSRIGWVNTILPLTVPAFFGGGAFTIFLFRQFFRTLPVELTDAARIDGASELGIYWRIILPLARPAMATVAVFTFIGVWNDFMGPLLYLSKDPRKFTVALGLASFRGAFLGRTRWDQLMAASTMMILPMIIIFFLAQRQFVQGIQLSGIKG
jgi:ABC-type glycerol-3-phosphate transport system permease component